MPHDFALTEAMARAICNKRKPVPFNPKTDAWDVLLSWCQDPEGIAHAEREAFLEEATAALDAITAAGFTVKANSIGGQHPDDDAVDFFAKDMKHKLKKSREKGRGGWADPLDCSHKTLAEWFVGHLTKTNPDNMVDLANLAMMLHLLGAMPHHLQDALATMVAARPGAQP